MPASSTTSSLCARDSARAIAPHARRTPTELSLPLSTLAGADLYLKLENLQRTGSFKIRGALNKLLAMPAEDRARGVVTASALVSYVIYTVSVETVQKFHTDYLGLTLVFPIYGIFRYLYLVHQKEGGGSPSDMLLNDRPLLGCVALWAMTVTLIIYWAR